MQQTTNYNLNKFDSTDELESATRLGLNENADTIDTALKGIQDDIDGLDASEVPYDNTVSGLTATDVQAALDEELGKIDILSNRIAMPDYSNDAVLHTFSVGDSWTASEDCAIIGYMRYYSSQSDNNSAMYVNGIMIGVAYTNGANTYVPVYAFVSAGDVITTNANGQYNGIKAYKLKTT